MASRSEGRKKLWANPEFKEKMDKIFSDKEFRKNRGKAISNSKQRIKKDKLSKLKSKLSIERWADPEYRKKTSLAISKGKKGKPYTVTDKVIAWRKGRKLTANHKLKVSEGLIEHYKHNKGKATYGHKGKKHSDLSRLRMSFSQNAIKRHASKETKKVLEQKRRCISSPEYKGWRINVFHRDKYTCQICERAGGKLNAHHLFTWNEYPVLRYDVNNGVTLCEKCHKNIHKLYKFCKNYKVEHAVRALGDKKWLTEILSESHQGYQFQHLVQ